MNRKRVWLVSFLMISFAGGVALAQQKEPPPPKPPDDAASSMETTAKFLQDKLNSIGRVSWSLTALNTQTGAVTGTTQYWEEVTRATINRETCEMRVTFNVSGGDPPPSRYFLEEADSVTVIAPEKRAKWNALGIQYTMNPAPYSVVFINGSDFKVHDLETANQIAEALRQLAQQCKVIPPVAGSAPSLEETLNFIEDRLNRLGTVNFQSTWQDPVNGTSTSPGQGQNSRKYSRAIGDPRSCRVMYQFTMGTPPVDFYASLNLRRVEKLTVANLQDQQNSGEAAVGYTSRVVIVPSIWHMEVLDAAGRVNGIFFTDEDTANRVAKAMVHAVELCGGGNKDPF